MSPPPVSAAASTNRPKRERARDRGEQHDPRTARDEESRPFAARCCCAGCRATLGGAELTHVGPRHPQRGDRAPADAPRAPDALASGWHAAVERRTDARRELTADGARALGDHVTERAHHRERHECEPVQRHRERRCVGHAPMELRRATDAVLPTHRHRASAEEFGRTRARHPRGGHADHAVARKARTHGEVEAGVDGRQAAVEPAECRVHLPADEHAGGGHAELVALHVVLRLVQFVDVRAGSSGRSRSSSRRSRR